MLGEREQRELSPAPHSSAEQEGRNYIGYEIDKDFAVRQCLGQGVILCLKYQKIPKLRS
jgi:hypothetical protein